MTNKYNTIFNVYFCYMIEITKQGYAVLREDTHIGQWVKSNKRLDFDQNSLPFILKYINEGDSVFDIGANIGCYAFAFLNKVGESGEVFCFEPSEESFECLEYNLGKYPNVNLYTSGIGAYPCKADIVRENKNIGMNYCSENKLGSVNITTLDNFNPTKCDFIKMDIEGYELDALIGAEKTIAKFKPNMYIEINEGALARKGLIPLDIFNWLHKRGYTFENIYPNQKMRGLQYDIICVHNEKI